MIPDILLIWHCTVIGCSLVEYGKAPYRISTSHLKVKECAGYVAREMCTMWLSSAVGSQSQAPLSLLCLDTDSE